MVPNTKKVRKEHSLKYYYDKKARKTGGEGFSDIDQLPDNDPLDDKEYKKSLNRQRYINLCVTLVYFTYFI